MHSTGRVQGVTVIELMIGIALLAILLGLAMPGFTQMLRNGQIRASAEGVSAAINLARAEAIRRNLDVRFSVISSSPAGIVDTAPTPCAADTGNNWAVWVVNPGGVREVIDSRLGTEGLNGGTVAITCLNAPGATNAGEIIFNSLGQARELTADANLDLTLADASQCAPEGSLRCLRVTVSPQGAVKTCKRSRNADGAFADCT
jgi:type IV fimbrial biogenesis protein FimT